MTQTLRFNTILTIILTLALSACGAGSKENVAAAPPPPPSDPTRVTLPADSPKLLRLRISPVEEAQVPVEEVTSPGTVEANPNRMAHVLIPVAGRITGVSVKIGDLVEKGQTVLSVESPDVDAAISAFLQADAAVTQARAGQAKAQADSDRARDLFDHNAVAQKEVINADALLTQGKAAVEQAQAAVSQARRRLEILGVKPGQFGQRVAVTAPISGKILEMNVVPGEFRNDTSSPLMTIADLSSVWVTADVPETSIRLVKTGEHLDIEFAAYPGETFKGRVTQIADVVDPQTRTIKVRAELDNRSGRLRPQMFGRMRHSEGMEARPVIPAVAVLQEEGQNVVWMQTAPGSFRKIPVQTGARSGDRIAIMAGLNKGDAIVVDGAMLLKTN